MCQEILIWVDMPGIHDVQTSLRWGPLWIWHASSWSIRPCSLQLLDKRGESINLLPSLKKLSLHRLSIRWPLLSTSQFRLKSFKVSEHVIDCCWMKLSLRLLVVCLCLFDKLTHLFLQQSVLWLHLLNDKNYFFGSHGQLFVKATWRSLARLLWRASMFQVVCSAILRIKSGK